MPIIQVLTHFMCFFAIIYKSNYSLALLIRYKNVGYLFLTEAYRKLKALARPFYPYFSLRGSLVTYLLCIKKDQTER